MCLLHGGVKYWHGYVYGYVFMRSRFFFSRILRCLIISGIIIFTLGTKVTDAPLCLKMRGAHCLPCAVVRAAT